MINFSQNFMSSGDVLPSAKEVSAVFLIAINNGDIVAIRNHRGWDLPAGHVEPGEEIIGALRREAREEASMSFENAMPFVKVVSDATEEKYAGKCMVGFATKEFTLEDPFVPAVDSVERRLMKIEEFILLHQQNKESMKSMIAMAQSLLGESNK